MSQVFQTLRKKVLDAIEEQRQSLIPLPHRQAQVLAEFIHLQLAKSPLTKAEFAQRLSFAPEQVEKLLQGSLAREALTEDVLQRLSDILSCDLNLLRIILHNREPKQSIPLS